MRGEKTKTLLDRRRNGTEIRREKVRRTSRELLGICVTQFVVVSLPSFEVSLLLGRFLLPN